MNRLEDTLRELSLILKPPQSREKYLAVCVKLRLEEQSIIYERLFDKFLNNLEIKTLSETDTIKLASSIKTLSEIISESYKSLLQEIKHMEKIADEKV